MGNTPFPASYSCNNENYCGIGISMKEPYRVNISLTVDATVPRSNDSFIDVSFIFHYTFPCANC
jgi:hypothetical protein